MEPARAGLIGAARPLVRSDVLSDVSKTPLLDRVRFPSDLKNLSAEQLRQLADELRSEMVEAVAATGGHLGAGLGVVELTVALHYVFDTPDDKLIWDVGHQANTTRSAPRTPRPRSPPRSAWRSRAT
jgi:hypothetical protein